MQRDTKDDECDTAHLKNRGHLTLAQPTNRIRKLGIFEGYAADDPVGQSALQALKRALRDLAG